MTYNTELFLQNAFSLYLNLTEYRSRILITYPRFNYGYGFNLLLDRLSDKDIWYCQVIQYHGMTIKHNIVKEKCLVLPINIMSLFSDAMKVMTAATCFLKYFSFKIGQYLSLIHI